MLDEFGAAAEIIWCCWGGGCGGGVPGLRRGVVVFGVEDNITITITAITSTSNMAVAGDDWGSLDVDGSLRKGRGRARDDESVASGGGGVEGEEFFSGR